MDKKFRSFGLLCGALLYSLFSFAQETQRNFVPPSPTASGLGIYGDIEVGYYTGVPNISIPVYTIQKNGNKFPIELKYHADGIKILQEATPVGLGWVLSGPGVITRSIRGLEDFSFYKNNEYNIGYFVSDDSKQIDKEPDIFYYNFFGKVGKFLIDRGKVIRLLKREDGIDIQIDPNNNWKVTTEDGTKYFFDKKEMLESSTDVYNPSKMWISAWYLTSIALTNGQVITFNYRADQALVQHDFEQVLDKTVRLDASWSDCLKEQEKEIIRPLEKTEYIDTKTLTDEVLLENITFSGGKVELVYSNRIDLKSSNLNSPKKLDKVLVYNENNKVIKEYYFAYDYFSSHTTSSDYLSKRLKLVSFCEKGSSSENNNKCHAFSYKAWKLPEAPPERFVPDKVEKGGINVNNSPYGYAPDPIIGTLNQIKYPTGGVVNFYYEKHFSATDGSNGGYTPLGETGIRVWMIEKKDNNGKILNTTLYGYQKLNERNELINSGKLLSPFKDVYTEGAKVTYTCINPIDSSKYEESKDIYLDVKAGRNIVPLGASANGNLVGYDQVTVSTGWNGENGKIEYFFINDKDEFSYPNTTDFGTPAEFKNVNGTLLKQIYYKYIPPSPTDPTSESSFVPVKEINYEYDFTPLYKVPATFSRPGDWITKYDVRTIQAKKINEEIITKNSVGDIIETNNYSYSSGRFQPSKIETTTSTGKKITVYKTYPYDMVALGYTVPYQEMVNKNIISPLVEEERQVNDVKQLKTYNSFTKIEGDLYLPIITSSQFKTEAIEERMRFTYDTFGNPVSVTKDKSRPLFYIWSYSKEFPVAEVKNSPFIQDIAYHGFENADNNGASVNVSDWQNWSYSNSGVITTEGYIGNNCYNPSAGNIQKQGLTLNNSYIISYWIKGTSPLSIQTTSGNILSSFLEKVKTINGWSLYIHKISQVTDIVISGSSYVDELRLHSEGAQMTTYTYDPLIGMTSSTDANNISTFYQYDELGRLFLIKDDKGNILKRYHYQFQEQ